MFINLHVYIIGTYIINFFKPVDRGVLHIIQIGCQVCGD